MASFVEPCYYCVLIEIDALSLHILLPALPVFMVARVTIKGTKGNNSDHMGQNCQDTNNNRNIFNQSSSSLWKSLNNDKLVKVNQSVSDFVSFYIIWTHKNSICNLFTKANFNSITDLNVNLCTCYSIPMSVIRTFGTHFPFHFCLIFFNWSNWNEGTTGRRDDGMTGRRDDGMKGRRNI